jgi:hypothetical protein
MQLWLILDNKLKNIDLIELNVRKPLVVSISEKKRRAETLQPGLEFGNLKSRLKSGIFKCISRLNGSFFAGDDRGFLKEEAKTYLMAPMSPLNPPKFSVFKSIVYLTVFLSQCEVDPGTNCLAISQMIIMTRRNRIRCLYSHA